MTTVCVEDLFVGKNEQNGISEFVFVEHPIHLFPGLSHTFPVIAVHHKYQTFTHRERECVCVVGGVSRYKRELEKGVDKCIFYSTQCSQVPVLWLRRTSRCSKRQHT